MNNDKYNDLLDYLGVAEEDLVDYTVFDEVD